MEKSEKRAASHLNMHITWNLYGMRRGRADQDFQFKGRKVEKCVRRVLDIATHWCFSKHEIGMIPSRSMPTLIVWEGKDSVHRNPQSSCLVRRDIQLLQALLNSPFQQSAISEADKDSPSLDIKDEWNGWQSNLVTLA